MQVRILTEEGLKQVRQFLEENPHRPTPSHLLEQNKVSAPVSGAPDIEDREFQNRYEFGRYLYEMLDAFVEQGSFARPFRLGRVFDDEPLVRLLEPF